MIPAARNDDSSIISGRWYRAWGWWGGHAPNKDSYQRPSTRRWVKTLGRWYRAWGWWGGHAPNKDSYQRPSTRRWVKTLRRWYDRQPSPLRLSAVTRLPEPDQATILKQLKIILSTQT